MVWVTAVSSECEGGSEQRERAGRAGGGTECRVNRQLTHIMWMSTFENKNPVTL